MSKASKLQVQFIQAVSNSEYELAKALLLKGAVVDGAVEDEAAIHSCARLSKKQVQWLLQNGADIDLLDADECTPLMVACNKGGKAASEVAAYLIDQNANTLIRRDDGMSALEFAAKNCDPELVEKLLKSGLPVDGPKGCDLTPAMHAVRAGNIPALKKLIALGANLAITCRLPWAKGLDCLGIAKLEGNKRAVSVLEGR